jgi:hypothetical protein
VRRSFAFGTLDFGKPQKSALVNDMHHNLRLSFFYFASQRSQKMQRQLTSLERMPQAGAKTAII